MRMTAGTTAPWSGILKQRSERSASGGPAPATRGNDRATARRDDHPGVTRPTLPPREGPTKGGTAVTGVDVGSPAQILPGACAMMRQTQGADREYWQVVGALNSSQYLPPTYAEGGTPVGTPPRA